MVTTDLYEPHSSESYAALRDDVARNGVRIPIVVSETGEIVDGLTRRRIADELGIDCPTIVVAGLDDERRAIETAVLFNARHRRIRREQRDRVVETLRSLGWSNRRIAAVLDVSYGTVAQVPGDQNRSPGNPSVDGSDGRRYPSRRATKAEIERRRDVIAALTLDGFKRDAIAAATGVSHGTVDGDRAARGVAGSGTRTGEIPPERTYWRSDEPDPVLPKRVRKRRPQPPEPPADVPLFRASRLLDLLERFHAEFIDRDYANQFAWTVDSAIENGDDGRAWLDEARKLLSHIVDEANRLGRIVVDERYRYECRATEEGREALRRPLRVVAP